MTAGLSPSHSVFTGLLLEWMEVSTVSCVLRFLITSARQLASFYKPAIKLSTQIKPWFCSCQLRFRELSGWQRMNPEMKNCVYLCLLSL